MTASTIIDFAARKRAASATATPTPSAHNSVEEPFDYGGFAQRLRQARLALGLTEEQAAASAGRTVKTWRKYEATGRGRITGAILQFSDLHRISLDWLCCGEGPMPPLRPAPHPKPTLRVV